MNKRYYVYGLLVVSGLLFVEAMDAWRRRGINNNAVEPIDIYNTTPYNVGVVFQDKNGDDSSPHYVSAKIGNESIKRTFKDEHKDAVAIGVSFVMKDGTESTPEYIGLAPNMKGLVVQDVNAEIKLTPLMR